MLDKLFQFTKAPNWEIIKEENELITYETEKDQNDKFFQAKLNGMYFYL